MTLTPSITETRKKLTSHAIYSAIRSIDDLRCFMSAHVFAVWDFMSLAKRLQLDVTCMTLPWQPPVNPEAARLINEIIFYEESDIDHLGRPCSHLDMYLSAMREVGACTLSFTRFLTAVDNGEAIPAALRVADVPDYIAHFVTQTLTCAIDGELEEVASYFLFGREDAIPDMFSRFIDQWGITQTAIPSLIYYFKRHIDLDEETHGPAARKLLDGLIKNDAKKAERANTAAIRAINGRIRLWDGILDEIHSARANRATAQSASC